MANSSTEAKTSYHARSISLPSRCHPLTASVEDHLCRLRFSSTASTSSSSICHKLGLLNDLYENFDDWLQLPLTQQALSQCHQGQLVEQALDGSLRLLDICGMIKDALLTFKESLQKLESSLRRRKRGESGHAGEIQNFQVSRKHVKRIIDKCLKNLSQMERCKIDATGGNSDNAALLLILEEVEAISLPILRSVLAIVFGTETKSRISGKSLLSKLMPSKQIAHEGEAINIIDQALEAITGQKTGKIELQDTEASIQELGEGLECLFRRLIKSRVSLLNILNH